MSNQAKRKRKNQSTINRQPTTDNSQPSTVNRQQKNRPQHLLRCETKQIKHYNFAP